MSLAGNLKDLSLVDLLQTIALSRKSGVLEICGESEVAWLAFCNGGIARVATSEASLEREKLLDQAGLSDSSPPEEIDACLWEAAVSTILTLLSWQDGDFLLDSLEDSDAAWRGPEGLRLETPLSPEFLVLECARLEDEIPTRPEADPFEVAGVDEAFAPVHSADDATPVTVPDPGEAETVTDPGEVATVPDPEEAETVTDPGEVATVPDAGEAETVTDPWEEETLTDPWEEETLTDPEEDEALADSAEDEVLADTPAAAEAAPAAKPVSPPVVIVDLDLRLLEAMKGAIVGLVDAPVHIFQHTLDGFERVKHYVLRGAAPIVVVGEELSADTRYEDRLFVFVKRIRRMCPQVRMVLIAEEPARARRGFDVTVGRSLSDHPTSAEIQSFVERVVAAVCGDA